MQSIAYVYTYVEEFFWPPKPLFNCAIKRLLLVTTPLAVIHLHVS